MDRNPTYADAGTSYYGRTKPARPAEHDGSALPWQKDQVDSLTERIDSGFGESIPSMGSDRYSSVSSFISDRMSSLHLASTTSDYCSGPSHFDKTSSLVEEIHDSGIDSYVPENPVKPVEQKTEEHNLVHNQMLEWHLPDHEGDTKLQLAICKKMTDLAFNVIQACPIPEYLDPVNENCQTALHLAVLTNQPEIVRCLVAYGADVHCRDMDGNTPLHLACARGLPVHVDMLTTELSPLENTGYTEHKLQQCVNERNYEGFTPLHLAAINNHTNVMKILIHDLKCDVNTADLRSGRTALHHAIERRHLEACHLLLQCQIDVNALTYDECSPLHFAAARGLKEEARALLNCGADLFLITLDDHSVFELASHNRLLVDILRDEQASRTAPVTTVAC